MTHEQQFEYVTAKFDIKRRTRNQVKCCCPTHQDVNASLVFTLAPDKIKGHCFGGCRLEDVLSSRGLTMKDMFFRDDEPQQTKPKWVTFLEGMKHKKVVANYDYSMCDDGSYAFTKVRYTPKDFSYGRLNGDRINLGGVNRKEINAVFGNVKAIKAAAVKGECVFICEGERDVQTMNKQGYESVFTCGSSGDWQARFSELVRNANLVILQDADTKGETLTAKIVESCTGVAQSIKVVVPTPDIRGGDVSDFFKNHSKADFEALVKSTQPIKMDVAAKEHVQTATAETEPNEIDSIVQQLVALDVFNNYDIATDRGCSSLFAEIFKDECRYCPTFKEYAYYDGVVWDKDIESLNARQRAKQLIRALFEYSEKIRLDEKEKAKYQKKINRLNSLHNLNSMLNDAKDINYFVMEMCDTNENLFNSQNVVLSLEKGNFKVLEHSPDMLLTKVGNVTYNEKATCENWEKFLREILEDDEEKIKFIQKICGMSLTGDTKEECLFIFFGKSTRNGKSTACEVLAHLYGTYAAMMKPETIAQKKNNDSRAASPDIARLNGVRFLNCAEPPRKLLLDTSLIKTLTGRDKIVARHLFEREIEFVPQFKLIINSNYLPVCCDDTIFSSERVHVIEFNRHFEPWEQDKGLKDRLKQPDEISGILNWALRGLQLYYDEGLTPPKAVAEATNQYREQSDKLQQFFNECMSASDENTAVKDVYAAFSKWCTCNGFGIDSRSSFVSELKNKNLYADSGTINHRTVRRVVKGYSIDSEAIDGKEQLEESLPFE